jgi:hypothetical protein
MDSGALQQDITQPEHVVSPANSPPKTADGPLRTPGLSSSIGLSANEGLEYEQDLNLAVVSPRHENHNPSLNAILEPATDWNFSGSCDVQGSNPNICSNNDFDLFGAGSIPDGSKFPKMNLKMIYSR